MVRIAICAGKVPVGAVAPDQLANAVHVVVEVGDEDRSRQDGVGNGFGDLRLAPAGDRARLVAEQSFGGGADEMPGGMGGWLLDVHLVPRRTNVGAPGEQREGVYLPFRFTFPAHRLGGQIERHVFGHVDDVGVRAVHRITLGFQFHQRGVTFDHLFERVAAVLHVQITEELLAQVIRGIDDRTSGVLLFGQAIQVRRITDLGLYFFFTISEVVIGNYCDNNSRNVSCTDFECRPSVVAFIGRRPTHAIAALTRCRIVEMRQTQLLLGARSEVGSEDHASAVTGPAIGVQRRIVGR